MNAAHQFMTKYGTDSGIAITCVRIQNFRSLANIEVQLSDLTVLIGANNAGKSSFLEALYAAVGVGRKSFGADDIRIAAGELFAPKTREVIIDLLLCPINEEGAFSDNYPAGSFWSALWGTQGITVNKELDEITPIRTTLKWSAIKGEYIVERKFLKEWKEFDEWTTAETQDRSISAIHMEPLALNLIDAKRDLDEDLKRSGSFWRRLTEDLGLQTEDIKALEESLSTINEMIVDKSEVLKHLTKNLAKLQSIVSADSARVDISPVARKLRDLSKGVDVSFNTLGAQSFPLARHGMGTRSLASLLVFRAYVEWKKKQTIESGSQVHPVLALEEPESHLHPQAQKSLFSHIKEIPGQRIVSTHSPYFAGQANLGDLRLFIKKDGDSIVTQLDLTQLTNDEIRKVQETVIETRGDLLFSSGIVFFEGQTEEQSLPIWAKEYWNRSIHELGFCFVRVNGTEYFPYIWLAKSLNIPWYIFADGETGPKQRLEDALKKANEPEIHDCSNVIIHPDGKNLETGIISEGYILDVEKALNEFSQNDKYLDDFIAELHGQKGKKGVIRDYKSDGGRERAAIDAMSQNKTKLAKYLANAIISTEDKKRKHPSTIKKLLETISQAHNLQQAVEQ